jgi:hypothetical protein
MTGTESCSKTIANEYPEIHSMTYSDENNEEYFYVTVQKGTPKENWLFVKMKTDGTVVQKITAPAKRDFMRRTNGASPPPCRDQTVPSILPTAMEIHASSSSTKAAIIRQLIQGRESRMVLCNCSHGLAVDTRYEQPLLLVCDRENRRLSHYDFDGKFVDNVTLHLRRPCQVSFWGDNAVVSELEGRVTILDKEQCAGCLSG